MMRRFLISCLSLAFWTAALPALAQPDDGCADDAVVNFVAARIETDTARVRDRDTWILKGPRTPRGSGRPVLEISVKKRERGVWRSDVFDDGLVGSQYDLKPVLPGYKVETSSVLHGRIAGECHAIYTFKVTRESWTLGVQTNTATQPCFYQNSATADWSPVPSPAESGWRRVGKLHVRDVVDIKVHEGTHHLFTIWDVGYKLGFRMELDYTQLVQKIISARIEGDVQPLGKDDPYLPIAREVDKSRHSREAERAAQIKMRGIMKLRMLTLIEMD